MRERSVSCLSFVHFQLSFWLFVLAVFLGDVVCGDYLRGVSPGTLVERHGLCVGEGSSIESTPNMKCHFLLSADTIKESNEHLLIRLFLCVINKTLISRDPKFCISRVPPT